MWEQAEDLCGFPLTPRLACQKSLELEGILRIGIVRLLRNFVLEIINIPNCEGAQQCQHHPMYQSNSSSRLCDWLQGFYLKAAKPRKRLLKKNAWNFAKPKSFFENQACESERFEKQLHDQRQQIESLQQELIEAKKSTA